MAAAGWWQTRHLHNWGAQVAIKIVNGTSQMKTVSEKQLAILKAIQSEFIDDYEGQNPDIILDAIMGYGAKGDPNGDAKKWIDLVDASKKPIISLDFTFRA